MIPSKVNVAGIEYDILEFEEIDDDPGTLGTCLYQKSLIKIKNNISINRKEQTFVHELLHAIINESGYNEQDEDLVNRVSIVLYQVLKDNKLHFTKEVDS